MKTPFFSSLVFLSFTAGSAFADGTFQWRGQVDGVDEIQIRGDSVRINHLQAQPIQNQDHRFTGPLPRRENDHLMLEKVAGRGDVRLVEEPSAWNNYTATVRIDDGRESGSDYYEFTLRWRDDNWDDWENNDWNNSSEWNDDVFGNRREGLFRWEGRVD